MSHSTSFGLLDERIQRYIWMEGWHELREVQEESIPLILKRETDVLITAATASGKTEAVFLPALTRLLSEGHPDRLIIYVSPLKALINDQFFRIERLCSHLEINVWPWHGDISSSRKAKFLRNPSGILLITPESLEAFLCRRGTSVGGVFAHTEFMVIDEFHAFIGTERGKQLQSLMHRIESAVGSTIPRIALSATLGDKEVAARYLRDGGRSVSIVNSKGNLDLKMRIGGYLERSPVEDYFRNMDRRPEEVEEPSLIVERRIADHLFVNMRGSNNLIFPNRRDKVELYTHLLSECAAAHGVPNEFWPHHGNLSKEIREETERALKSTERPATAICTSTLELGIDIGTIRNVAQIGAPPSVASLRQRLGRSGRRSGESATLYGYVIEQELTLRSGILSRLRISTVQFSAMTQLLLEGWFEPPPPGGLHLSTFVQQLLSSIAQHGGIGPWEAYRLLSGVGASFSTVAPEQFKILLRHLATQRLIIQDPSGVLLLGEIGERFVNHHDFYAVFATDDEYRLVNRQRTLGSLPVRYLIRPGQRIIFAGRTWMIAEVDRQSKTIVVELTKGGVPPIFSEGTGNVHEVVRERMLQILDSDDDYPFLDKQASTFLNEGRRTYKSLELHTVTVMDQGLTVLLLTWLGDDSNEALVCLMAHRGFTAWNSGIGVEIVKGTATTQGVLDVLKAISVVPLPADEDLLRGEEDIRQLKWDWALPEDLLAVDFSRRRLNMRRAIDWIRSMEFIQ